jgi:hypothetical protein
MAYRFGSAAFDPLEKRFHGQATHLLTRLVDGRQRHVSEGGEEGVVVADDRNVAGDREASFL